MNTILLIESHAMVRESIKEFLVMYDYDVVTVADHEEGFAISPELKPMAIICGSSGVGMSDWDVFNLFRGELETAWIPLVITTTCDNEAYRNRLMRRGANAVLKRPFEPNMLLEELGHFVRPKEKQYPFVAMTP